MGKKQTERVNEEHGFEGPTLAEKVDCRQAILKRIDAVKDELQQVSMSIDSCRIKAREANLEAERYQREIKEEDVEPHQQARLDRLKESALRADLEEKEATERFDKLTVELSDREMELSEFDYSIRIDEVFDYQKAVECAEKLVNDLKETIKGQEAVINEANSNIPSIDHLTTKREDILADITTGKATEDDLNKLDKQIATESKALSEALNKAVLITNSAKQAVAGLQRKLAQAERELQVVKEKGKEVLLQFLRSEAEAVGTEYMKLGQKFRDEYTRLMALSDLMKHHTDGGDILGPYSYRLTIPLFKLKVCQEVGCGSNKALLFDSDSLNRETAINTEKDRLRSMGITLI